MFLSACYQNELNMFKSDKGATVYRNETTLNIPETILFQIFSSIQPSYFYILGHS